MSRGFVPGKRARLALSFLLAALPLTSQDLAFHGQLSGWFILNDVKPSTPRVGLRYLPSVSAAKKLPKERAIDGELSLNAYLGGESPGWKGFDASRRIKPYRAWARFSTPRLEARVGLQKLNFGSAMLLRPLMWFDSVDPRDPLSLTDGVYGLLVRYSTRNNTSLWGWGLYGNGRPKGWESVPTREKTPEFGGRIQAPVPRGELAFTTHHRRADFSKGLSPIQSVPEHRYGLDGKWDLGPGVWFEGVLTHQGHPLIAKPYQAALNIGADYTFGLGGGLHVLGEHFTMHNPRMRLLAATVSYPAGLLDTFSGIVYVDTDNRKAYNFASWKRTYDHWSFFVMGFWNPAQSMIYQGRPGQNVMAGRGVQIMAVFNH